MNKKDRLELDTIEEEITMAVEDEEFKKITRNYIKQDENNLHEFKGKLEFIEINKTIEYIFPIDKNIEPLFVIRMN